MAGRNCQMVSCFRFCKLLKRLTVLVSLLSQFGGASEGDIPVVWHVPYGQSHQVRPPCVPQSAAVRREVKGESIDPSLSGINRNTRFYLHPIEGKYLNKETIANVSRSSLVTNEIVTKIPFAWRRGNSAKSADELKQLLFGTVDPDVQDTVLESFEMLTAAIASGSDIMYFEKKAAYFGGAQIALDSNRFSYKWRLLNFKICSGNQVPITIEPSTYNIPQNATHFSMVHANLSLDFLDEDELNSLQTNFETFERFVEDYFNTNSQEADSNRRKQLKQLVGVYQVLNLAFRGGFAYYSFSSSGQERVPKLEGVMTMSPFKQMGHEYQSLSLGPGVVVPYYGLDFKRTYNPIFKNSPHYNSMALLNPGELAMWKPGWRQINVYDKDAPHGAIAFSNLKDLTNINPANRRMVIHPFVSDDGERLCDREESAQEEEDIERDCPICFDEKVNETVICERNHTACEACILGWCATDNYYNNDRCPICRLPITFGMQTEDSGN